MKDSTVRTEIIRTEMDTVIRIPRGTRLDPQSELIAVETDHLSRYDDLLDAAQTLLDAGTRDTVAGRYIVDWVHVRRLAEALRLLDDLDSDQD